MLLINIIQDYLLILRYKLSGLILTLPKNYKKGEKGDILLIVGFNGVWTSLKTIADEFNKQGYRIHFPQFNTHASLQKITEDINQYIESKKIKEFSIISHSKGGIVSRLLLDELNTKINKVFNIATPNEGTIFGYIPLFNLHELKPNSRLIKTLKALKVKKIVNIYSRFDNHVIPNSSLRLEGSTNIKVNVVGHTRILESKETLIEIKKLI
jgi:triacylglycerol esterase/lipase EstA (alpha/beta hydrolase family)